MKFVGGILAGTAGENVGDLVVGRPKPLHLPRRLEPLHDSLPSSRPLVEVLHAIIEAFMLPVLDAGHDLTLGGCGACR
jgi:hypothetical protein